MSTYVITAEVDQKWYDILCQITKHQEGFVWCEVKQGQWTDNKCDVCEAPDGTSHCDCGQCDCGEGE